MDKKIPIYFDTIILDSPIQEISLNGYSNDVGNRLQVAVFTKYKNRNGSYITDAYADLLIESATRGDTPVVGFFDPESQSWASHTGPTLANGYGYIESFLGWKPLTDTDGITRDYAVFSVVIFTKYYEEAKKIRGQNQSMELDPATIQGDWANFDGEDYFVYTKGDMLGLCVIGQHEPCFSVSTFFSKNDESYKSQYQKFSSLLAGLKAQVEEAENTIKGGEQPMENLENLEIQVEEVKVEGPETFQAHEQPEAKPEVQETEKSSTPEFKVETEEPVATESEPKIEETPKAKEPAEPTEFEKLQQEFNALQESYNSLQSEFEAANIKITELESANAEIETLRAENEELQASVTAYEVKAAEVEKEKKNILVEKYEKIIGEEEIEQFRVMANDLSYDELESKLAITFANKQMTGGEDKKVPLPETQQSQFALLMNKYRKNK